MRRFCCLMLAAAALAAAAATWSQTAYPAKAGTPREIVERVSRDIQKVLAEPQLRERIIDRGGIPDPRTPQGYADFIRTEIEKWAQVAKTANVRLDQ